jgi:lipopolysaccharide transport system permease protein
LEKLRTIIKPPEFISLNLRELWQHRELLYFFAWRDIKVKYRQTVLGVLWALLQPLALMLLFVWIFSRSSIGQSATGIDYPVFVLSGLILWNLFYASVSNASESMLTNANIIKKIYFPRLIIPISALCTALVDFGIAFLLFLVFCLVKGTPISIYALLFFPAGILVSLLVAFGFGTLLGALNVKFRDFRYALPFLLQFLFFASQIVYSFSIIRQPWQKNIIALNPMNAAIELFRYPLSGTLNVNLVVTGSITALLFAVAGLFYFQKTEIYFADIA